MENIVSAENTSQQSFDLDMSILNEEQVQAPVNGSQDSNVHTNVDESNNLEIDERFKGLPREEAIIRTLQSQKDKYYSELSKLTKETEQAQKIAGLFDQILEDENLFYAFVRQVKPELVKPVDLGSQLKAQLQKEFGEDYKPKLTRDEAERDDPFGTDARYYMKVDALKTKLLQEGGQENVTVKEYLTKKRKEVEDSNAKYEMERQRAKEKYKMEDAEVQAVTDWGLKLDYDQLVQVHRFLRKFSKVNPNLNQVAGSAPGTKSSREAFLDNVF